MATLVNRNRRGRRAMNEINMVPFIDVMLVLLIIFMVTAPLITPSLVDLPSIGRANATPDRPITLTVLKDGSLELKAPDGAATKLVTTEVGAKVKAAQVGATNPAAVPVVIAADKGVQYETVVSVMDALQRAGVQRIGLAVTQRP
jgi:biopolymer transport protein TolR